MITYDVFRAKEVLWVMLGLILADLALSAADPIRFIELLLQRIHELPRYGFTGASRVHPAESTAFRDWTRYEDANAIINAPHGVKIHQSHCANVEK